MVLKKTLTHQPLDAEVKENGVESSSKRIPFGKEMAKQFMFAEGWRNMNHGSFGTYPLPVRSALHAFQAASEARPDHFVHIAYPTLLIESRHAIAKVLNAPPSTIVLVPNATTGINTVLRNLVYAPGDTILYFSTTYGACGKTILSISETTPATPTMIPLLTTASLSTHAILTAVRETITSQRAAGLRPRALLLDTVVSMPALRLPFEELTALCREEGVYSVVDGAHSIGMFPIDVAAWDPDFYITNAHKWLHVPRACAVMYVPTRNQALMRTSYPTSHFFVPKGQGAGAVNPMPPPPGGTVEDDGTPFVTMFAYMGTLDNSPYLCVPAALKFRQEVCGGEDAVMSYVTDLARRGGDLVAEMLGTECLENEDGTLRKGCSLVCVKLPFDARSLLPSDEDSPEEAARKKLKTPDSLSHILSKELFEKYNTRIPILWWGGSWWARLSAQVYLDMDDFAWTGGVLKELCEKVKDGRIDLGA